MTNPFASFFSARAASSKASAFVMFFVAVLTLVGCGSRGSSDEGLLSGKSPRRAQGVRDAARLTDGLVPPVGSGWNSTRTSVFSNRNAFVEYDLGREATIEAVALLGDNNDGYRVLTSADGSEFTPLWTSPTIGRAGLQWRTESSLGGKGRFVRVQAVSGDSSLAVAEIALFASKDAKLPPRLREVSAGEPGVQFRSSVLVAMTLLGLLVVFAQKSWSRATQLGAGAAMIGAVVYGWLAFVDGRPFGAIEVSFLRSSAATLAILAVVREAFFPKRYPGLGWLNVSVLAISATVSIGAFFNLGTPQFFDEKNREPSVVHNYDMRVYYPVAKYFKELRYDGLYLASVMTYAEEHGGVDSPQVQGTELRDLRDHRMRRVRDITPQVVAIKQRFSPERWAELKEDMRYFWETMGPRAYLGSMADHGGNATPVWLAITHLMFRATHASNAVLLWGAVLDPLLLLAFAVVVYRTFGVRTALVSLVLFGANDYYMFGSNWAGATLRNDWMVYLGIGACALKAGRYKTGGAFLAMSALIRAFPAACLLALAVPVLYFGYDYYREKKKLPTLAVLRLEQKWFVDAATGAIICALVSFALSSLILGAHAWPLWVRKIQSFTASPHVNHMSLLTVTSGSEYFQQEVLRQRAPFHGVLTATYVVLAIWAAYKKPPHVAALLGMLMVPVFMYPANYYMHFVFLLALLVEEPHRLAERVARESSARVWTLLLAMCGALYLFVKEQSLELHFYNGSVVLMAALMLVLVALLPRAPDGGLLLPWLPSQGDFDAESLPFDAPGETPTLEDTASFSSDQSGGS